MKKYKVREGRKVTEFEARRDAIVYMIQNMYQCKSSVLLVYQHRITGNYAFIERI